MRVLPCYWESRCHISEFLYVGQGFRRLQHGDNPEHSRVFTREDEERGGLERVIFPATGSVHEVYTCIFNWLANIHAHEAP